MNAYDFDGTIFPSNCTISFAIWCMNRHPKLWLTYAPRAVMSVAQYKLGKKSSYRVMRELYSYLRHIDDFDIQIERYWDKNEHKIASWYLKQKKPDDLIISASPTCIIEPIARRLGVNLVATDYDRELGVLINNLMYAQEKSRYIIDHDFPVIEHFYSDSLSDTPLALCAEHAHLVTNGARTVTDWPELDERTKEKVKKEIDTGWTIHLEE
ncbi:MAG: haloacid dehalogenase-like hydrolase [Atopobiaceae bacterium]|nr:haloacid dehalogenase-like hydrolase [Atopobiaceae bacterium]MDO4403798.1 haloacid dehalogenase-like hydrolase [Atopobiaceae bacterium]